MTQALAFPAKAFPPANYAANTCTTNAANSWIVGPLDMSIFRRALGIVNIGATVGASCTVTATFMASSNSNTSNTTSWTQVSGGPSVSNTANTVITIEMRSDQMPSGSRYLLLLVNNQCATFFDALLIGGECCYKPASQQNVNTTLLNQAVM